MIKNLISVPLRYALIVILLLIIFTTGLTITLVCLRQNLENRKNFNHAIGYQLSLNINQNLERLIHEIEDFKVAFAAYLNKDWKTGAQLFAKIAEQHPNDQLTKIHLDRCKDFVINPPDLSWDGGQAMNQK